MNLSDVIKQWIDQNYGHLNIEHKLAGSLQWFKQVENNYITCPTTIVRSSSGGEIIAQLFFMSEFVDVMVSFRSEVHRLYYADSKLFRLISKLVSDEICLDHIDAEL
jgi:hypothetical protein